jgi:thiamine biosynthesis lipoprotein
MKPDGQPWWVDVQLPPGADGAMPTRIALHDLAVATSGDYLQGFSADGRWYGHCIDPRSGWPIDNGVCSVTVLHAECMLADAWSTALMVLGPADGAAVAEAQQLAVQWLVRNGEGVAEHCSSAYLALVA